MILQELTALYQRLRENPDTEVCEPGFARENISFKIVIDGDGNFKHLEDLRVIKGKQVVPVKITVPKFDGKRASGIRPYFLWDKSDYTVGYALKDTGEEEKPEHHGEFQRLIDEVAESTGIHHEALCAVRAFSSSKAEIAKLKREELWQDFLNTFAVFEVEGWGPTAFDIPEVIEGWRSYYRMELKKRKEGLCAILGGVCELAGAHPTIKKGVGGKTETPLVSCNIDSGESYGKKKGQNAPISAEAASSFTGALNYLIDTPRHNIRIADTLTLFWAEANGAAEDFFGGMFDRNYQGEEGHSQELEVFLKEVRKGRVPAPLEDNSSFFVLGLAPNAARISVRFWHTATVKEMGQKIVEHFQDLQIIPEREKDNPFPSLWQLLIETATQHKTENIPANIVGPLMRSLLSGTRYPSNILSLLIGRVRTDQGNDRLNYYRASFIKAILNRNYEKEITVALDTERDSTPYCLGRLFSVLEKTQKDSSGGKLNVTIKDRYFASASATPGVVFPRLLSRTQNHLKKLKDINQGAAINREKLMGQIVDTLSNFPARLKLEEQGEFAIGYYHQTQDFYKKQDPKEEE